ncbi:MAG TPA: ribulose-phosphate 3-epimerase [Polyangiaceae bacterium]
MRSAPGIAPSLLAADFSKLAEEIREVEAYSEAIHVDVMDGQFVPNIAMGPSVVSSIRSRTSAVLDCHLMVNDPDRYVEDFVAAGADWITIHVEAGVHLQRTLAHIRQLGKRAGVALCPHTPEEVLRYLMNDIDLVLVMCVNPGFSGQTFLTTMLNKMSRVRDLIDASSRSIRLEVDGGINEETAEAASRAGADLFVAGAAVFGSSERGERITAIRDAARRGVPA